MRFVHVKFISAVLRLVSAVLLFGNMEFFQEKKSDQAILPDDRGQGIKTVLRNNFFFPKCCVLFFSIKSAVKYYYFYLQFRKNCAIYWAYR